MVNNTNSKNDSNKNLDKEKETPEGKTLKIADIKEKHGDLDFENNSNILKNQINNSNRPYSRKRSAYRFIEEIEKDQNEEQTNTKNNQEKRDSLKDSNNPNNFDNFHNLLINNKSSRTKMPEIKNPTTYNKIQMPSLSDTSTNNNTSNTNNMNSTHFNNTSSKRINENNFHVPQKETPQSSKKPEIETRRRKLVNNNIFNAEIPENMNLTTANPTTNNLLNFENQIKVGCTSNKNYPTPSNSIKYSSNFTERDSPFNSLNTNSNSNSSKFNSANSRIMSRRQANNSNKSNLNNNSYFANTNII